MHLGQLLQLTRPLILVDLETTAGDPAVARILQYAHILYMPDGRRIPFKTLVNPRCPIPPRSTEVHGVTDEIILHGCAKCRKTTPEHPHDTCEKHHPIPFFSDLAANLFRGYQNADVCGYNQRSFDTKVMVVELGRCGHKWDASGVFFLDGYRLWMQLEKRKLADFVRRFAKRELENAHDAMADVEGTEAGLVGLLQEYPDLPRTVQGLHEFTFPVDPASIDSDGKFIFVDGVPCFNFGKYRGQPMKSQPGYLRWMLNGDFSAEVKAICQLACEGTYPSPQLNLPVSVGSPSDGM